MPFCVTLEGVTTCTALMEIKHPSPEYHLLSRVARKSCFLGFTQVKLHVVLWTISCCEAHTTQSSSSSCHIHHFTKTIKPGFQLCFKKYRRAALNFIPKVKIQVTRWKSICGKKNCYVSDPSPFVPVFCKVPDECFQNVLFLLLIRLQLVCWTIKQHANRTRWSHS